MNTNTVCECKYVWRKWWYSCGIVYVYVYTQPMDTAVQNKSLTCWYLKWQTQFDKGCLGDVICFVNFSQNSYPKLWGKWYGRWISKKNLRILGIASNKKSLEATPPFNCQLAHQPGSNFSRWNLPASKGLDFLRHKRKSMLDSNAKKRWSTTALTTPIRYPKKLRKQVEWCHLSCYWWVPRMLTTTTSWITKGLP